MQYAILIYDEEPRTVARTAEPARSSPSHGGLQRLHADVTDTRRVRGRRGAPADHDGDHGPGHGRPDDHDRRPVRRDQGGARRLLPRRGRRSRRSDRLWRASAPAPRFGARSRSGRSDGRGYPQESAQKSVGRPRADADTAATHEVVDRLFREEQGRAVATLIRVLGDFDLAEEAVQDAFIAALEVWPDRGIPDNPGAWITTTARNRAIDRLRRRRRLRDKTDELGPRCRDRGGAGGDRARRRRRSERRCPSPTTDCG